MQNNYYIDSLEQAKLLLKPERIALLQELGEPRTCLELAEKFGQSPQKINYHIKTLEKAGLVEKVAERRVRGTVEGHYQAKARSYWLAPQLVGQIGSPKQAQDQASLRLLLSLAEQLHEDIGRLGARSEVGEDVPSLGLSADIYLPNGRLRYQFLQEVQTIFTNLATKYGDADGEAEEGAAFRLFLAAYPTDDLE